MFASTPSPAGLSTALLDEAGSGVGLLLLDRPARAHAYNAALLDAFEEGLWATSVDADDPLTAEALAIAEMEEGNR